MEKPAPRIVGVELDRAGRPWRHRKRVLARRPFLVAPQDPKHVTVQMHRVIHRRRVGQGDAHHLAMAHLERHIPGIRRREELRIGDIVHQPDIFRHVAAQAQVDAAFRSLGKTAVVARPQLLERKVAPFEPGRAELGRGRGVVGVDQTLHPLVVAQRGGMEGVVSGLRYGYQQIVALGGADHQVVDLDGLDVLTVGGNHGQGQAGNGETEEAGSGGVDDPEPEPLAGPDRILPGRRIGAAVEQIAGIGHVGRESAFAWQDKRLVGLEVDAAVSESGNDRVGVAVVDIAKQQRHVVIVAASLGRILDDQGTGETLLLLQLVMRVIPIGAGLNQRKLVEHQLSGFDGRLRHTRHAVLQIRWDQSMPVD